MRSLALRLVVLVLAVAQPLVAAWVQSGAGGPTIGALLDRYPSYVVPASYALGLAVPHFALGIALGVLFVLPSRRADRALDRIALPVAAASFATSLWMIVFQHELFVSGVVLVAGAVAALALAAAEAQAHPPAGPPHVRGLVHATLGLQLAWASIGLLALAGHAAEAYGWSGFGLDERFWAYVAVVMGGFAMAGSVAALRGNPAYAAAAIWGFLAIAAAQWSSAREQAAPSVGTAALFAAMLVAISASVAAGKRRADRRRWVRRGRIGSSPA
jgi:hypothetical protein